MTSKDVLDFANKVQVCWLATAEGDRPHVRGMMMWYADESGFYFHTASCKRLAGQIEKNPEVELAFYHPGNGPDAGRMLRVAGRAEAVTNPALTEKLYKERPWAEKIAQSLPDARLVIFRVRDAVAQEWTMSVNGREGRQPQVKV